MEREYESGTANDASFFLGEEVEHTPAYKRHTLFVVGVHSVLDVVAQAEANNVSHIYLGANQSCDLSQDNDRIAWTKMTAGLLNAFEKEDMMITLDFDVKFLPAVHRSALCDYNKFIPMISVKVPSIRALNYNACIKVDDTDFDDTNPGVWVHRVHDLQDQDKFTHWGKYTSDTII